MKGHGRVGAIEQNTSKSAIRSNERKEEGAEGETDDSQLRHSPNDAVGSESEDPEDDGTEDDSRSSRSRERVSDSVGSEGDHLSERRMKKEEGRGRFEIGRWWLSWIGRS